MTSSVWIVTAGTYSDFHIVRVFSDADKAEAFLESLGHDPGADIEEWILDDWQPQRTWWRVELWDDTLDAKLYGAYRSEEEPDQINVFHQTTRMQENVRLPAFWFRQHDDDRPFWIGWVQSPTKDRAIKIATELVAMAKAHIAGIG
jgi:hypothetical protein